MQLRPGQRTCQEPTSRLRCNSHWLTETLHQPKFDPYLNDSQRSDFLAGIVRRSRLIEITTKATLCRDPKDDKFLELAASGCATHLVTGDRDLLVLQHFGETAILSCRDFLTRFS